MDTLILNIVKIISSLIFVLLLIYTFYSLSNKKLRGFKSTEVIKIIERVSLSKDTHFLIVTLGDKGYFIVSGPKGFQVINQLTFEEIRKIQEEKAIKLEINKNELGKLIEKFKVKDWHSK